MRLGAAQGLTVWMAYGLVEYFFASILEAAYRSSYVFPSWHWHLSLSLFGFYALAGLVVGGAIGLTDHFVSKKTWWPNFLRQGNLLRLGALFSLLAAFSANTVYRLPRGGTMAWALLTCLGLALAAVLSAWSPSRARPVTFLANPWTASLLLLAPPWTIRATDSSSRMAALGAAVLSACLVVLISILVFLVRTKFRRAKQVAGSPLRLGAALARLVPITLAALTASLGVDLLIRSGNSTAPKPSPGFRSPNIVWIVMDAVRADHLSAYGYKRDTAPNLKGLAAGATLYRNAIAPAAFTLPSHASMFTGLYPSRHGAHYSPGAPSGRPLTPEVQTLAEVLSEKGYFTAGVTADFAYLGTWTGLNQGYRHYEDWGTIPFLDPNLPFCLYNVVRPVYHRLTPARLWQRVRQANDVNRSVLGLLDRAHSYESPFFLFINYMDAHSPASVPPPFRDRYPGRNDSLFDDRGLWARRVMTFQRDIEAGERRHLIAQYDGAIAYIDFHLGRVFARLKKLGLYEDCLLIVTSDHGEAFGERNLVGHAASVYQDEVHVPLIIKYPTLRNRQVVDEFVSGVDIMPTVLGLLGFELPQGLDGQSLLRLERGGSREIFAESLSTGFHRNMHPRFRRAERALFQGTLKLISSSAGKRELYDLKNDPDERRNLYHVRSAAARQLQQKLDRWQTTARPRSVRTIAPDRKVLDRLRALGYVQ